MSDYKQLYSLDVLGVEDRGENDHLDVYTEFKENIARKPDGRYEVNPPWIPGSQLSETDETQSRQRLRRVERKLEQNSNLREEYERIIESQIESRIIEKATAGQRAADTFSRYDNATSAKCLLPSRMEHRQQLHCPNVALHEVSVHRCRLRRTTKIESEQEGRESLRADVYMRDFQGGASGADQNSNS